MKTTLAILVILTAALTGCESGEAKQQREEQRQHHMYALQTCIAETIQADRALIEMSVKMDAQDMQAGHNGRAAECMADAEKTTLQYQFEKHDDYGKVPTK